MKYRQSLLTSFATCPRRALHGMAIDDDVTLGNVGASADLGSAFHATAAEILRTLYRQGEQAIPTEEAITIMREVLAAGPWILPADERDDLRALVLSFAGYYTWDTTRIMALEKRLEAEIPCPDGEVRTFTGQPDLLLADPPGGAILVDWKSGRAVPPTPRAHERGETITGKQYLSDRGHAQLDAYGFLVMRNYPGVQRTTLRELHLRSGEVREATLDRDELEHIERELADLMMKLDRAILEGEGSELWRPRPGRQCLRKCPVSVTCPVPAEQRGVGMLSTEDAQDAAAARYVVVDAVRQTLREALKAAYEESGRSIPTGDGRVLRKEHGTTGTFGFYNEEADDERSAEGVGGAGDPAGTGA